jgi:hypothetical protein
MEGVESDDRIRAVEADRSVSRIPKPYGFEFVESERYKFVHWSKATQDDLLRNLRLCGGRNTRRRRWLLAMLDKYDGRFLPDVTLGELAEVSNRTDEEAGR